MIDEPTRPKVGAAAGAASVAEKIDQGDLYARVGDYTQALITYLGAWPHVTRSDTPGLARRIAAAAP